MLDTAGVDKSWVKLHPSASVKNLWTEESDHYPIILQLETKEDRENRPFRFFQAWTMDAYSLERGS